jgi:hypothetical protein
MGLFQTLLGGSYKTPDGEKLDVGKLDKMVNIIKGQKRDGPCHIEALRRCFHYQQAGIPYKMVHGTYKGEGHKWVEYKHNGKWLIDDPAQKIKGWPRKRVSAYSQEALETVPDFRR